MIILVGFMGCGKSTVSKKLSEVRGVPCFELDAEIVNRSGEPSIAAIFENLGEQVFRDLESAALNDVLQHPEGVCSTGGGIVESPVNRELLRASPAPVVWLKTSFEVCEARVTEAGDAAAVRPLFLDRAVALDRFERRQAWYEEVATRVVATDSLSVGQIVAQLSDL